MDTTISESRLAGRQDYLDGKPPVEPPERVFIYGREKKTAEMNTRNAKNHREYMTGYDEAKGME